MSSNTAEDNIQKPLRILTIDNGGLQAISILRVLKEVCRSLSEKDGHSTPLRPCQLFDIIGGVGTGGWLAILLGRYRLRIDQCMSVYVTIANAIDPKRQRQDDISVASGPVAISQETLIEKIDDIIAERKIGEYLIDEEMDHSTPPTSRRCHAFAVGVVKGPVGNPQQEYRLFRTYRPSSQANHQGPDPAKCKVSLACAATAAAKDFLDECLLDVDRTTYWDDTFPRTHNVSELALDEAVSLFGGDLDIDFVLNASPGVVSADDVKELIRTASMHISTKPKRHRWSPRRLWSTSRVQDLAKPLPCVQPRASTDPGIYHSEYGSGRQDTSDSTSTEASETELGHQKDIKDRLYGYARASGRKDLYFRLELTGRSGKPYLDDIAKPEVAMQLAEDFLELEKTSAKIEQITNNLVVQFSPRQSVIGGRMTLSPTQSYAEMSNPSTMRTASVQERIFVGARVGSISV